MSEEDGLVSSRSICAAMSDLVGKLTFSSKLLRFVSCFGEVSLFEPLLAFLFFLLVGLTILSYFHLEKTSRVAEPSKARPFTATARPNPFYFIRKYVVQVGTENYVTGHTFPVSNEVLIYNRSISPRSV